MYRRFIETTVDAALSDTPVVLLNGARQTGKTTFVRNLAAGPQRSYYTLDDAATLAAATADPQGFVRAIRGAATIDEVQKAPGLLPAIKLAVDEERTPGRFLLTGSANVMSLPAVSESLAGRIQICTLWPLSQGELRGVNANFIDTVFSAPDAALPAGEPADIGALLACGGYPEAVARANAERRATWFGSYVTTILQRDVRDIAHIDRLLELPRLLALLAARTAGLMNAAELSRASGFPLTTLKRYLSLLELTYLIQMLPAWSANPGKRLIKSAKVHVVDTGLAAYLVRRTSAAVSRDDLVFGNLLESFVAMELFKQAGWAHTPVSLHHLRTTTGREVDVVLEGPGKQVVGIEVKASSTVHSGDFAGLRALAELTGERFLRGIVLYGGDATVAFGDRLVAAPISALWAAE